MGVWIVGVISFQKIFGLCGRKRHKWREGGENVGSHARTLYNGQGRTECEDRTRILFTEFAIKK